MTIDKVKYAYQKSIEEFRVSSKSVDDKKKANELLKALAKDSYNIAEFEILNYSRLTANKEVVVDKYISENDKPFREAFKLATEGKITAIIGDTGVGKGYTLDKILKEYKGKVIIVQPSASVTEQMGYAYDTMVSCFGRGNSLENLLQENNVVVCTWNKLKTAIENGVDFSEYVLIKDEAHEIVSNDFRFEVIRPIEAYCDKSNLKFKGVIDITATPTKLNNGKYDYIAKYSKRAKIKKQHLLYDKRNTNSIVDVINKAKGRVIVVENNIENLKFYMSKTRSEKTELVYSDIKEQSKAYESIMKHSDLGDCEVLFTTNIINAGINIYNKDVTDIIVIDVKDTTQIAQIDSRCREVEEINIHIFNNYPETRRNFRVIERDVKTAVNLQQAFADILNASTVDKYVINIGLSIGLDNSLLYQDTNGKYVVDEARIRANCYADYYKTRDREQFANLLLEFSSNIKLVNTVLDKEVEKEKKEVVKESKEKTKQEISDLGKFKKYLVGFYDIYNGLKLDSNTKAYLDRNNLTTEQLKQAYTTFNLNTEDDGFIEHNKLFTKYVVEDNFDLDFAWNLAKASKANVKKAKGMIDTLRYLKLKEECDYSDLKKMFKANPTLYRIDFLINELSVGTRYTIDTHIPILLKEINKKSRYGQISETELKKLINLVFVPTRGNYKLDKALFYKGKLPKAIKNKKYTNAYEIDSLISIDTVANLLGVDVASISLNKLING